MARNREQNSDTLAALDILNLVPSPDGAGPGAPYFRYADRIGIEKLRTFDLKRFMADADRSMSSEERGQWDLPHRVRILDSEHNQDVERAEAPDGLAPLVPSLDALYNRPIREVKKHYAEWMIRRYRTPHAASKVAECDPKSLEAWRTAAK